MALKNGIRILKLERIGFLIDLEKRVQNRKIKKNLSLEEILKYSAKKLIKRWPGQNESSQRKAELKLVWTFLLNSLFFSMHQFLNHA